jgi:lysophospholipase L1-like esterase
MGTLIAYGHSWVAGEAATSAARGFVETAARVLGLAADNRGVGGSHAPDTAGLVSGDPPPAADVYVVMTGLNDARSVGDSPDALARYAGALQTIFARLGRAAPGAPVIAIAQPPLLDYSLHPPHDRGSDEILLAYNEQLRTVAGRHPQVVVAEVSAWDPATMLDEDTVHPNDAGHAELARAVVEAAATASEAAAGGGRSEPSRPGAS